MNKKYELILGNTEVHKWAEDFGVHKIYHILISHEYNKDSLGMGWVKFKAKMTWFNTLKIIFNIS